MQDPQLVAAVPEPQPDRTAVPVPALFDAPAGSAHEPPGRPWELELLISGAVVFALMQLPALLDGWFEHIKPHLAGAWISAAALVYGITDMVLYALIGAFVVHLAARAYWVGLVGLDTVFPDGVRWEKTRLGPFSLELQRARQPSLQSLTDRADRFCSVIFSFSFSVAILLVGSMLPGAVMFAAMLGVSKLTGVALPFSLAGVATAMILVLVTPQLIDRRFGARIAPGSRTGRVLGRALRLQNLMLGSSAYRPIFNVISSNVPHRAFVAGLFVVFFAVEGGFLLKMEVQDGGASLADYHLLPADPGPRTVDFEHYADEWPEGRVFGASATIQSEVVRDPFVRLFLPFSPRRHNPAAAERCPGIPAAGGARDDAVIRCLLRLQPVTLNGTPIESAGFRFYTDPRTGLRGILAHLPTRDLPAGENLLVVAPAPRAPGSTTVPSVQYIPFWVAH